MMKIWKIAVVITLAVALLLGITLPGLADSGEAVTVINTDEAWGKWFPRIIRGEVVDIGDSLFFIQSGEQEATIYVTDDTRYFKVSADEVTRAIHWWRMKFEWPGLTVAEPPVPAEVTPALPRPDEGRVTHPGIRAKLRQFLHHVGEEASFDNLERGDIVVVLLASPLIDALTTETEEKLTARVVLIIKPSVWGRTAGTIKRLSNDAIVIEPVGGGDAVPLRYDESTTFILKGFTSVEVEQFARAVYNTETMVVRVVRVWSEAPPLPQPAE